MTRGQHYFDKQLVSVFHQIHQELHVLYVIEGHSERQSALYEVLDPQDDGPQRLIKFMGGELLCLERPRDRGLCDLDSVRVADRRERGPCETAVAQQGLQLVHRRPLIAQLGLLANMFCMRAKFVRAKLKPQPIPWMGVNCGLEVS